MPGRLWRDGALLTTCLLLAACGGQSNPAGAKDPGEAGYAEDGTFTYVYPDDLGAPDPYRNTLFGPNVSTFAYDSLVNILPGGKFVSGLAEKWTVSPAAATFTLRSGISCSDGTSLTASMVSSAITYVNNPKNASSVYGTFVPTQPLTVTADDASRTVRVSSKTPYGLWLYSVGRLPIVCPRGIKDPKLLTTGSDGTGPFVLTAAKPGQSYTYTLRKGYTWGPDGASTDLPGLPKTLVIRVIANESTTTNLLLSGEVNLARIAGKPDQQRLSAGGLDKVGLQVAGPWLWFNQLGQRPGADKRVRQALVQALDLDELVKVSTDGQGKPPTGLGPLDTDPCPGSEVFGQLPKHDVAAAEALLDTAGWVKGADGIRHNGGRALALGVHYVPTNTPQDKATAELAAQRWRAVGVDAKLVSDTFPTMLQTYFQTSDWDVYVRGWNNSMDQMAQYLSGPGVPKGSNVAGIDNPRYNALVAKAQKAVVPQACADWDSAEQALWQELNPVPLSDRPTFNYLNGAKAEIMGLGPHPIPTSIRVYK